MSPAGRFAYWGPPVFWAFVILTVSSLPGVEVAYLSFDWGDKLAHLMEYAILGVLLGRLFSVSGRFLRFRHFGTLALGVGFAGVDELHQLFIPNRFCEWGDFLFDAAGLGLGLIVYIIFRKVRS